MIALSHFVESGLKGVDISKFHQTKICLLGGTGFIGTWLVKSMNYLSLECGIRIDLTIYARNKASALIKFPPATFRNLTIEEVDFSKGSSALGKFDFFINGATPTSTKPGADSKEVFFLPTINAISSIIDSARRYQNHPKVVNLSSGTVYGDQPMHLALRPEGPAKVPDLSDDDYRAAKISSEGMLSSPDVVQILKATSPRLFTFYGPGLPLDKHFAIGNFVRDGLKGLPIRVQGSPDTRRSYMFPSDLVAWVLKSILDPKIECMNIGSEISFTMLDLATLISEMTSKKGVALLDPSTPANNYVPSTEIFRSTYDVKETFGLESGLTLWLQWLVEQDKRLEF